MQVTDLEGGQGRNRTIDTRIFRESNGLRASHWTVMGNDWLQRYLFALGFQFHPLLIAGFDSPFATDMTTAAP